MGFVIVLLTLNKDLCEITLCGICMHRHFPGHCLYVRCRRLCSFLSWLLMVLFSFVSIFIGMRGGVLSKEFSTFQFNGETCLNSAVDFPNMNKFPIFSPTLYLGCLHMLRRSSYLPVSPTLTAYLRISVPASFEHKVLK